MTSLPYIKWYGAAWRSDPLLRLCSAAARGVWADCLSLMIEAEPYGHLAINGKAVTAQQFGALTSTPVKVVKAAWDELESNGVWTRGDNGIVYSRRLVRDKAKLDLAREHGKAGGNPNLKVTDNGTDNQEDNPEDNPEDNQTLNPPDNPIRKTIDDRNKTIEKKKEAKSKNDELSAPLRVAKAHLNGHATASPENRKSVWFQRVQAFVNARLPAERAISLVTRYLDGEAAAKREFEEWARLEKESRQAGAP